ncbi:hypothetical protein RJ640_008205 [Escallonia rubra]|uniref:YchF C-terminal domain-containing protein n=1 Tax=Escallonia rubra TaxID=112253 RepID=A0AA88U7J5_9ASTE|nr:hypothetical protein RJ640_008205 [Escallonia rubra]
MYTDVQQYTHIHFAATSLYLQSSLQQPLTRPELTVESELTELPSDERTEYLKSLGVDESGLGNLIRETYSLLGLQTYFTSGEKETKAWTILAGMTAPQAAGVIHSDFEKGFIRAETVSIVGRDVKFPWKNYSGYL